MKDDFCVLPFDSRFERDVKRLFLTLQLHIAALDGGDRFLPKPDFEDAYFDYTLRKHAEHDGALFVAVRGDRAIGVIACEIYFGEGDDAFLLNPPKSGFVSDLVVADGERGRGIGKALLAAARRYFGSKGCDRMELHVFAPNKSAYDFYVSQGFAPRSHAMLLKF